MTAKSVRHERLANRLDSLEKARESYNRQLEKLATELDRLDPAWGSRLRRTEARPFDNFIQYELRNYRDTKHARVAELQEHYRAAGDGWAADELARLAHPVDARRSRRRR